jgi:hypothetical protein
MLEQGWIKLEVTLEHLQDLMSLGSMTAVELATCRVPEGPVPPIPAGGYVVDCAVFYERGFNVPPHWFICSLL